MGWHDTTSIYNGYSNSCKHFLSYYEPIQNEDRFNIFFIFLLDKTMHISALDSFLSRDLLWGRSLHFFITLFTKRTCNLVGASYRHILVGWLECVIMLDCLYFGYNLACPSINWPCEFPMCLPFSPPLSSTISPFPFPFSIVMLWYIYGWKVKFYNRCDFLSK